MVDGAGGDLGGETGVAEEGGGVFHFDLESVCSYQVCVRFMNMYDVDVITYFSSSGMSKKLLPS